MSMSSIYANGSNGANKSVAQTVADDAQTGSDWFRNVCKQIFGKDAGLGLHLATGVPERSCYRYASGERDIPVLVFRALIHSDQGAPFMRAFMDGCTAQWWQDMQRNADVGAQVRRITNG